MPKQKGIIKIHGALTGTTYYPLYGEYLYRIAYGPCKKIIQTNTAYAHIKASQLVFGMASNLTKAVRTGILETANNPQALLGFQLKTLVKLEVSTNVSLVVWFGFQYLKQKGSYYDIFKILQMMQGIHLL